ncbi:MAG: hypothetical protein JWN08_3649, partial [Frankiales bacterium]|nr:hypothetical protein [Frankiales bacterium]
MTLLDSPPTTATGPTVRTTARSARGPLLAVAALAVTGVVVAALSATGARARLDPDSYGPSGSRAVAELLRELGTEVVRVDTVDAALAAEADLLLLPEPRALATSELERLAGAAPRTVVVGADDEQLAALGVPAEVQGADEVEPRQPVCGLPAARTAGDVDLGGLSYRGTGGEPATGCYAVGGEATLLVVGDAVLLGDGALLTNDRLAERGNAALALRLLSRDATDGPVRRVAWVVPLPGRPVGGDRPSLRDLVADGVYAGAAWLLVVVAVVALWRARRLGRVVDEPL